jgi:hypothetical protein
MNLLTRIHVNFSQYSDCKKSKSWLGPISKRLNFTSWNLYRERGWYCFDGLKVWWRWHINWWRFNSLNLVTRIHVNFSQYSDCQKSKSWLDPISKSSNFTSLNLVLLKTMILVWWPKSLMKVTCKLAEI